MTSRITTIVSGGMDSVTLVHHLAAQGLDQSIISFDYGQRHLKELAFAAAAAQRFGCPHQIINLTALTHGLKGSALTDNSVEVPDGHYAEESMKSTVVPNRNMIMISIAAAFAIADKRDGVAIGVHAGDHFIYPDCRPEFIAATAAAIVEGNEGFTTDGFELRTPFIEGDKTAIARLGGDLGVPWDETWSCYKGGDMHCGSCGTCVERREALSLAGVHDPTPYLATPSFDAPS